jgi:HdeA/HdeB family
MLKLKSLLLGSMFGLLVVSAALAQVTIDVSKITCEQYVLDQVIDFRTITAWLDGFYSGKRNNTVVDTGDLKRNADKVEEYCRSHHDMPLMQAVETTLGGRDRAVGSKK